MAHIAANSTNNGLRNHGGENPLENDPLPLLVEKLAGAEAEASVGQARVSEIEVAIQKRVAAAVSAARKELEKTEGAIRVVVEGCEVKSDVPKNVSWDQAQLMAAARLIGECGEDPQQYIDFKASISEKKWDVLPKSIL